MQCIMDQPPEGVGGGGTHALYMVSSLVYTVTLIQDGVMIVCSLPHRVHTGRIV